MEFKHKKALAELLEAISGEKRLTVLENISEGAAPKELPDKLGIARSTVQHYVDDLKEAGLIKTEERQYRLTGKGEEIMEWLKTLDDKAAELEREQLRGFAFESSLSIEEIEEVLEDVKDEGEEST